LLFTMRLCGRWRGAERGLRQATSPRLRAAPPPDERRPGFLPALPIAKEQKPSFKGEAARLRATGSRAAERPKQDAQGWVAWRGPDGRA